mmetsp:Transcript_6305/g.5713  ORF Transcript_6305/g.5713 Transcript_6305/m.5713 type:complete len:152 (-) Transcript_6305:3924-4379(-)
MSKLCPHLSAQLNDLRSTVSKEACKLVCLAAKKGKEKLEQFCEKLISGGSLLKIINSANRVINENGHECILTIIENIKSPKIIPKIVDEVHSKNNAVRNKVAQYLRLILDIYEDHSIEKHAMSIENGINLAIGDANGEVRHVTRQAFLIYE